MPLGQKSLGINGKANVGKRKGLRLNFMGIGIILVPKSPGDGPGQRSKREMSDERNLRSRHEAGKLKHSARRFCSATRLNITPPFT